MQRKYWYFFALNFVLFLSGCVSPPSVNLSKSDQALLNATYLDPNVTKPSEVMFLNGSPGSPAMGLLGTMLTTDTSALSQLPIKDLMIKHNIDISALVFEEAKSILASKPSITLTPHNDKAKVLLKLSVDHYGLAKTHPFGSVYDANMRITARLLVANERLIWQESQFITGLAMDNNKGQTLPVYYANPETLRVALATGARVLLKRILSNLPD
jgi:hypothetical protein